jgi:hypothetical protein
MKLSKKVLKLAEAIEERQQQKLPINRRQKRILAAALKKV